MTTTLEILDTQAVYAGLEEAWDILAAARRQTCNGPNAIYNKVYNAQQYIDRQVKELLAAPPE